MPPRNSQTVVLVSRLRLHGRTFATRLEREAKVEWVGNSLPHRMTLVSALAIMTYEFLDLLLTYLRHTRSEILAVIVQFISLDAIPVMLFRRITGVKVVLYAVGSDVNANLPSYRTSYLRWVVKEADGVLCVNSEIRNAVRRFGARRTWLLPTPFLYQRCHDSGRKVYEIVSVGALIGVKNFEGLIEACALADPRMHVAIVGGGPLLGTLTRLSMRHGLDVDLLGNMDHSDVLEVMGRSKIYVQSSKREGIPSSILEAISCGLPVIAVKSAYSSDLSEIHGFRLIIADDSTPLALASKIRYALEDYGRAAEDAQINRDQLRRYEESWFLKVTEMFRDLTQNDCRSP